MLSRIASVLRIIIATPLFALATLIAAGSVVLISFVRRDAALIDHIIRGWARCFLMAAGARLSTTGGDKLDRDTQYVFAANHLSNLDIPAMFLSVRHPIRFLAKKEVYSIPLFGRALIAVGMIRTDREARAEAHAAINEGVADARRRGHSIIVFPEGTRSLDGKMHEFRKGAFRIAITNGLPVVPVSVIGTWDVWKPGSKVVHPGRVRTIVHAPISTEGLTVRDINALRLQVEDVVRSALPTS